MIKQLANWQGVISVNGVEYGSVDEVSALPLNDRAVIRLIPANRKEKVQSTTIEDDPERVITVRQFMTQVESNPMPMRTMVGKIKRETAKAYYMELHGQALPVVTCMRCGRSLTNPVSRHYGLGIECIQKVGIPFEADDVENIKEALVDVKWTGWLPKSAILENQVLTDSVS